MEGSESLAGEYRINVFGERETDPFVVDPEDAEGTTVRGWLLVPTGSARPLVMLEAEDRDSRNRRALLPELARGMVDVLATLSRQHSAGHRPFAGHTHPGWCARQEGRGEPHRSRELTASVPRSDGTISARLVHGRRHVTDLPSTFIDIGHCDETLAWPPIGFTQHEALIRALATLLGHPLLVVDSPRNPIEVRTGAQPVLID